MGSSAAAAAQTDVQTNLERNTAGAKSPVPTRHVFKIGSSLGT